MNLEIAREINDVRAEVAREREERIAMGDDIRAATAHDLSGILAALHELGERIEARNPVCSVCQAGIYPAAS